jgi:hypothetical protein
MSRVDFSGAAWCAGHRRCFGGIVSPGSHPSTSAVTPNALINGRDTPCIHPPSRTGTWQDNYQGQPQSRQTKRMACCFRELRQEARTAL